MEPFSYLANMAWRDRERGFDLTVKWEATKNDEGLFLHHSTRLVPKPLERNIRAAPQRPRGTDGVPPKLFLCMNRVTRQHRQIIVCHLLRRGLLDRSLVSFRDDDPDQTHFGRTGDGDGVAGTAKAAAANHRSRPAAGPRQLFSKQCRRGQDWRILALSRHLLFRRDGNSF